MTSPVWLPQEVQPSVSGSPAVGPAGGSSTPVVTPALGGGTPVSKGLGGTASESIHDPSQAKFANHPGYGAPALTYLYGVPSNSSTSAGGSQQLTSSSVNNLNPSVSTAVAEPSAPSLAFSAGPSFSYNISQTGVGFSSNQHFQSNLDISTSVAQAGPGSSASTSSQSVTTSSSSTVAGSSTPIVVPTTSWMPTVPSFPMPPGLAGTPGPAGLPGLVPSAVMDSNSSKVLRPSVPAGPASAPSNPAAQHQIYPTHPSLPPMGGSLQGLWLQPPQMNVMPRPTFLPYPAAYPAPFPLQTRGLPHPSVPSPDSQPPGVPSMGSVGAIPTSSAVSGHQVVGTSMMQTEPPPSGIGMLRVYARLLIN